MILVLLLVIGAQAFAQESGRSWTVGTLGTFKTQREAEQAIQALGSDWAQVRVIKSQAIAEDEISVTYWIGVAPSAVQNWTYRDLPPGGNYTEEDQRASYIAYYNRRSVADGCVPNTTAQRTAPWIVLRTWGDGVSWSELGRYDITFIAKRSFPPSGCMTLTAQENPARNRTRCANPLMTWDDTKRICENTRLLATMTSTPLLCDRCGLVGNPSDVTTGNKYQPEPDLDLGWVAFSRYYQSGATNVGGGFGYGWTHSHNVRVVIGADYGTGPDVGLIQADGAQIPFKRIDIDLYEDTTGSGDRLIISGSVWTLNQQQRQLEFDNSGFLTVVRNEDGSSLAYAYNTLSQLTTITHNTGRQLEFSYDPGAPVGDSRVLSVAVSGVAQMTYAYTATGMLDTVTYADTRQRKYHYEDLRFPSNLTGITDENSSRYSTFAYDAQGRAVSSMHAGGVESTQLVYSASGGAQVTDANGLTTQYALASGADGKPRKVASVTRPASENRPASSIDRTYNNAALDFRRRLNRYVDRNNNVTTYDYQTLTDAVTQREVTRYISKEAFGTTIERLSQTDRDAASNRMVMRQVGNQALRATRNARLQPVALAAKDLDDGATRTTTMSYCEQSDVTAGICPMVGLLTAVDGPRNDVVDVVSHSYRMADESSCIAAPMTCPYRKGDLWKIVNANNQITEVLAYDSVGRAKSIKDVNGVITDVEYSPRGWLTASKMRGIDNASETDDRITRIDYWPDGSTKTITQPDGAYALFGYDDAHRLTSITDSQGNAIRYTLNANGDRERDDTFDAANTLRQTLSRTYNTLGQLQAVSLPNPNPEITTPVTTSFRYDAEGNLDKITDAISRETNHEYDALGRLKRTLQNATASTTATDRAETAFQYDALDRLTKVTDPKMLDTNNSYNGFGDQTRLLSEDTGTTHYTYDSAGNRAQRTDANGKIAQYGHDALNRVTTVTYPQETALNETYLYDVAQSDCPADEAFLVGRLSRMSDGSGSTAYCHNRFGDLTRKLQRTQGKSFTLQWTYAANGRLQTMRYPDGSVVDYLYDSQGRVVEMGVAPSERVGSRRQLLRGATYHPFGPVAEWTYGNGRVLSRSLNKSGQPGVVQDTAAGGISLGYQFDEVGNLKVLRNGNQANPPQRTYEHDGLNRLTSAKDAQAVVWQSYSYDKTGNRIASGQRETVNTEDCTGVAPGEPCIPGPPTTQWSGDIHSYWPGTHRLMTASGAQRNHDTAGNLISIVPIGTIVIDDPLPTPNESLESAAYSGTEQEAATNETPPPPGALTRRFTYSAANRLASVSVEDTLVMSYRYNGHGERVYRSGSSEAVHTVFDQAGHWIGDYDANGVAIQQAIWLGDLPVGLARNAGGALDLHYVEADTLATPRVVIDPDRDVAVWRWALTDETFGESEPEQDPDGDNTLYVLDMRYPGQQYDSATGFNYNYFRDYDPSTGRYSQSDPIGLGGGISTYGYVLGNPLAWADPLGLQAYRGQTPPSRIPGGPWTSAGSGQKPGTFYGPKNPNGGPRAICRYVPDGKNGGGGKTVKKAYWKIQQPGGSWDRYDLRGRWGPPEKFHPHPSRLPLWVTVGTVSSAGLFIALMTYSPELNSGEDDRLPSYRELQENADLNREISENDCDCK